MSPFRISARIDNPRFRVTFDEGDSACYCNSVKSLAAILRVHGRAVSVRRLRAIVGPDDRRRPRTSRRESSFEGAHITRLQYARQRPHARGPSNERPTYPATAPPMTAPPSCAPISLFRRRTRRERGVIPLFPCLFGPRQSV
jgi:hypothetical protein